jgi:S-adenosylmethionine synthetase
VYINTFGTGVVPEDKISAAAQEFFDLTPRGIIRGLDLLKPIYRPTASYGHFGREAGADGTFSWERTDKAEQLHGLVK